MFLVVFWSFETRKTLHFDWFLNDFSHLRPIWLAGSKHLEESRTKKKTSQTGGIKKMNKYVFTYELVISATVNCSWYAFSAEMTGA